MGLIDSIIGAESGGNPNAKNPNSSATGAGQFIDRTWLSMLAKHRPDLTGSPQELLALRSDPQLSRAMTEAYAADNGQILTKAGVPVTPGTTYLAHFAGPQGAVSVLQADPNAPVSDVLGSAAVKANPFLRGMTVSGLQAWADKKMGAAPAAAATTNPTPAPVPGVPAAPAATQAPPIFASAEPQQAAQSAPLFSQMQAQPPPQMAPIFTPPRKQIDLSKLKTALASGNRGLFFGGNA